MLTPPWVEIGTELNANMLVFDYTPVRKQVLSIWSELYIKKVSKKWRISKL